MPSSSRATCFDTLCYTWDDLALLRGVNDPRVRSPQLSRVSVSEKRVRSTERIQQARFLQGRFDWLVAKRFIAKKLGHPRSKINSYLMFWSERVLGAPLTRWRETALAVNELSEKAIVILIVFHWSESSLALDLHPMRYKDLSKIYRLL
ncbi:hypothetical protein NPIL_545331 [Nephila pilipes]|uniref:Uncharacterized protein n=1 Tax=Nephila pilipes TaxID=299642 RepID=A0A8X6QLT5_NEPPI|nr:hypothetical protein NPIL_545331 [Nephila pilipes]